MPFASFLWQIYRKRWLARYWQSGGVRVIVDVFVEQCWRDYMFLGVPKTWGAFATRWESLELVQRDYAHVMWWTGEAPKIFAVYGGGKAARAVCMERGWTWINGSRDAVLDVRRP
jgi:hypothetical protein